MVGVSHCCDLTSLPSSVLVVTEDQIHAQFTSQADIHTAVLNNSNKAQQCDLTSLTSDMFPTLYPINKELLLKANPNVIVTQDLCHVCAPDSAIVCKILKEVGLDAHVVLLTPLNLSDVISNVQQVADACGISEKGSMLCQELQSNLQTLKSLV